MAFRENEDSSMMDKAAHHKLVLGASRLHLNDGCMTLFQFEHWRMLPRPLR